MKNQIIRSDNDICTKLNINVCSRSIGVLDLRLHFGIFLLLIGHVAMFKKNRLSKTVGNIPHAHAHQFEPIQFGGFCCESIQIQI